MARHAPDTRHAAYTNSKLTTGLQYLYNFPTRFQKKTRDVAATQS